MGKVYVDFDEGTPRYVCTDCGNCGSMMGISLCEIKNRGCCSYFPEFTLVDIHKMSTALEGLHILDSIVEMPSCHIYPYHLHVKGVFDKAGYENYLKNGHLAGSESINDHTIFFRTCPFVKSGYGCTLPPRYRNYICNFFICREILDNANVEGDFHLYADERSRYVRWVNHENAALQHILFENGVNLEKDIDGTVKLLQEIPLSLYEFPVLEPVNIIDEWFKGA